MNQPSNQIDNHHAYHLARLSKDARFDGQFFTAVITTGIFCRPICPARPPKEENVRYFTNAIQALEQGFSPCKRCLPELAPHSYTPPEINYLIELLQQHNGSISAIALAAQLSERQIRRIFHQHFAMSPNQYWQQHRLLTALKLLKSSNLTITEIAYIAGFNSIRRFNEAIKSAYQQPPKQLQKKQQQRTEKQPITVELFYRPPFDWPLMLSFFKQRLIPELEQVTDTYYARIFQINNCYGWFKVSQQSNKHALLLEIELSEQTELPKVIKNIRRMFDLDANLNIIHSQLSHEPILAKTIEKYPGLRLPGNWDIFEFSIRAILGQQISVKAATTIASRICKKYGEPAHNNPLGLTQLFPTRQQLLQADFLALGLTQTRIETLTLWCQFYQENHELFQQSTPFPDLEEKLIKLKGIGPWTINYLAMRGLSYPDAFPSADLGIIKALKPKSPDKNSPKLTNKAILAKAENWRPWRSYAAIYLWHSLIEQE